MPGRLDLRDDADLAGERVGAAHAVDLARVGRAHDGQQQAVARRRVGGQVVGEEIGALGGAAAHHHAGHGRLHTSWPFELVGAVDIAQALLLQLARACRRCRGRARPRSAARGSRASLSSRSRDLAVHRCAPRRAATITTPSSSATTTSPGLTSWPAKTSGTFTEPRRLLDRALRGDGARPDRETASRSAPARRGSRPR